jgi:hypothetical protein
MRIKSFKPDLSQDGSLMDDWVVEHLQELGAAAPFGNGRVQLGLAFDGLMLPKQQVISIYEQARKLGAKVITTHYVRSYFSEYTLFPKFAPYRTNSE